MRPLPYVSAALLGAVGIVASGACADLTNLAGGGAVADSGPGVADASLGIAVAPASLDFGIAGCGTQVPPQTVTLENTSSAPITFEASLPEASGFTLGGQQITTTSGTVAPGGRTAIAISVATLRTLGALSTKLTVKVGDQLHEVPITVTGLGARLEFDRQVVDFGEVYYSATAAADVTISNSGTEEIRIAALSNLGTDFTIDPSTPLPIVVPKAGTANLKLAFAAGQAGAPLLRDITFETDAKPLCGDKPLLSLRAVRVNTDVTINPGTVDFGKQPCGAIPAIQAVTVTNYGPTSVVVDTTSVGDPGSRFQLPAAKLNVPAAVGPTPGTAIIKVAALKVAPPLGVTTEALALRVNGAARSLTARIDPRGIILGFTPLFWSFLTVGQKRIVVVTNTGNENAVTFYSSDSPAFTPGVGATIFPNTASNMEITYTPPAQFTSYIGKVATSLQVGGATACTPLVNIDVETK
jgi:hypothetical protein